MEKLTKRKNAVLDVLDEQIEELEAKLAKVQPLIEELNKLRQTRRVLLDEKGTTGGGGRSNGPQLTQEQVILFMREKDEPVLPEEIATALGVANGTVRSHLQRHKDTTYERTEEGWVLIGDDDEED